MLQRLWACVSQSGDCCRPTSPSSDILPSGLLRLSCTPLRFSTAFEPTSASALTTTGGRPAHPCRAVCLSALYERAHSKIGRLRRGWPHELPDAFVARQPPIAKAPSVWDPSKSLADETEHSCSRLVG